MVQIQDDEWSQLNTFNSLYSFRLEGELNCSLTFNAFFVIVSDGRTHPQLTTADELRLQCFHPDYAHATPTQCVKRAFVTALAIKQTRDKYTP